VKSTQIEIELKVLPKKRRIPADPEQRNSCAHGIGFAILVESDNTAAILLMRSAGGPAALTRFVRGLGDTVTRSDRYEPDSNRSAGVLDTTSPKAIATTAQRLLLGDVLSAGARAQLERGMTDCKPGLNRLRAVLPVSWQAADRPGTSVESKTNDYALVRPPRRAPLIVAVYYDAPGVGLDAREAVLREAGTAFVQWAEFHGPVTGSTR